MAVMGRRSRHSAARDPGGTGRRHPHRPLRLGHWRADGQAKRRFGSQNEAEGAAGERRAEAGADLVVYRCDFCGGWHLGNRDPER